MKRDNGIIETSDGEQKRGGIRRFIVFMALMAAFFWIMFRYGTGNIETDVETSARAFTLVLWSVLLEALPFVLLGTILSSLIQLFVSEDTILKILPKNNMLRLVLASLLGLIFPVCECAIIPITRALIKKGMPVGPAIAFMLATPIVNPVVLLSTYNAFPTMPQMVLYRGLFGFIGAVAVGFLAGRAQERSILKDHAPDCGCAHDHEHRGGHSEAACAYHHHTPKGFKGVFREVLAHTSAELKSVGMYLIFGAMIASAMQIFVPKEMLFSAGSGRVSSIVIMMALAFVLSLCSEADAFIANTFLFHFSGASVLAFLITGPMIDIKNTMMLFGSFKHRFVVRVILTILLTCLALALIASFIMGGAYA